MTPCPLDLRNLRTRTTPLHPSAMAPALDARFPGLNAILMRGEQDQGVIIKGICEAIAKDADCIGSHVQEEGRKDAEERVRGVEVK